MFDLLDIFASEARERLSSGYYEVQKGRETKRRSLVASIRKHKGNPIIAELKAASPSAGILRKDMDVVQCAAAMQRGGAVGLSVLTVPQRFNGHLGNIPLVKSAVDLPVLMKDFVVSGEQVDAAAKVGADGILLISSLFRRRYVEGSLESMIARCHTLGLEVLLETHNEEEYKAAFRTQVEMVGVNNRDLESLTVDLEVTRRLLAGGKPTGKVVISESGICSSEDIHFLKSSGADAFLVGSSIMGSEDIETVVGRLSESQ
jgi:indole-3-glycerol phosphate synthase